VTNWVSCGGQCVPPTTACCLRFTDGSRRACLLYSADWCFVFAFSLCPQQLPTQIATSSMPV